MKFLFKSQNTEFLNTEKGNYPAKYRRTGEILFFISFIALVVVIGGYSMPKYAQRLLYFGLFLIVDFLYFPIFKSIFVNSSNVLKRIIRILFWLPVSFFLIYILASKVWPIQSWIPVFKIYFTGLLIPLFLWKFILLIFLVLGDLFALPLNIIRIFQRNVIYTKKGWYRSKAFVWIGVACATFFSMLLVSGYFFWVYNFEVKRITIESRDLPKEFDGLKIVQISDLHLGSWISTKPLKRAVEIINSLHPDIVVFTGDLVNYSTTEAYLFRNTLLKINAPLGKFSILGNHDYGDYVQWESKEAKAQNDRDLVEFFESINWQLLVNENSIIHRGEDSIALIGVENWSSNKIWGQRGDLKNACIGIDNVAFQILLSHDPTHWRKEVLPLFSEIDLTLSGHTHAMQFGWEGSAFRWSPSKWLFSEWAGLYSNSDSIQQYLYVNRGLGHLGFPGRVGIRPEITEITFKRK